MKLAGRYVVLLVVAILSVAALLTATGIFQLLDIRSISISEVNSRHLTLRRLTADEFRTVSGLKTGNPLIDDYGHNDVTRSGEQGRGISFTTAEKDNVTEVMKTYRVNIIASDIIPLNRLVPDSRFPRCRNATWNESLLPTASVIVPFHDEWFSILMRTVYSIINRTPHRLLQEIILLDDVSTFPALKQPLDDYLQSHFPDGLVRLVRFPERVGLIKARQEGIRQAKGKVVVIFDSHMEVNHDWLQPMLAAIRNDRRTVALATLDYIQPDSLEYRWHDGYLTRYGFDWRLIFFETYFRPDQFGASIEVPKKGTVMVGTAYAMDRDYFNEIGGFDDKMKVWGGENLEVAWRVWMCGGQLLHTPCSKIGHIARSQPYEFPGGRRQIEVFNYKRAVEVWMEPEHKFFIYENFPEMKNLDVGDLTERLEIKEHLKCKTFSWFLDNIWPELFVYNQSVHAWGSLRNAATNLCLDNHFFLFDYAEALFADQCHFNYASQGFSWTLDGRLRTTLQCVVLKLNQGGARLMLESCITGQRDYWEHTKGGYMKHLQSGLCLDLQGQTPILTACRPEVVTQQWTFNTYNV